MFKVSQSLHQFYSVILNTHIGPGFNISHYQNIIWHQYIIIYTIYVCYIIWIIWMCLILTTSIRTRSSGQCVSGAICSVDESSPSSASPLFQMTKPPWMLRQALPEPSLKAEDYKINSTCIRSFWKSWYKCLHNLSL